MVETVQLNAEVAVLGSLMLEPRLAGDIFSRLSPENFSSSIYRNIFVAAQGLFFDGAALDPVIVLDKLGKAYESLLADIMQLTPTANNYSLYVDTLINESRLRQLNQIGAALMSVQSYEEGLKLLSKAEGLLSSRPNKRSFSYAEMIHEYLDRQESETPPDYIDWGLPQLNRLCVTPGRFIILGADSSVGKTAFALQLAVNVARSGKRVGFFSYETSQPDVIDRIMANRAGVMLARSKERKLTGTDYNRVNTEGVASAATPLTVIESAEYTVDELRAETLAKRFEVIFIDYLQLIPGDVQNGQRWQEVGWVSRALHSMAQRLGVTIVALSQVTLPETAKNGQRPHIRKENLRESRQLIMDADVILLLDLEDPCKRYGERVLYVDKNKDGPLAQMRLSFDAPHMRFYFLDRHDEPEKEAKPKHIFGQSSFYDLDDDEPTPFEEVSK